MAIENHPSKLEKDKEISFQDIIAADERIEPSDWMPQKYRTALKRQMSQHAHSEWVGMLPEAGWLGSAPSLERKAILLAKVQDEAGHALYIYSGMETLGYSRDDSIDDLLSGKAKFSIAFHYPFLTWGDVPVMGWLGDAAAIVNQIPLCRMSYGPYSRAMIRVCKEESFHQRQGYQASLALANGSQEQREMLQESIDRMWWTLVNSFGMPDKESAHTKQAVKWKIKRETNDELRDRYINMIVPQIHALGLTVPDPKVKWNEDRQAYDHGGGRFEEMMEVVTGNGPVTRERIAARVRSHAGGAWVREAAVAYEQRHSSTQMAAE